MPTKSKKTYTVANPKGLPKGIRIFVCVNTCNGKKPSAEFYEGDTIDLTEHTHLNPARLIRDGFIHG